jgi:iron complex outermembrane receptor protein
MMFRPAIIFCSVLVFAGGAAGRDVSGRAIASIRTLKQMSLDELTNLDITSVSRVAEPYHEAAAALAVVTEEQIRRSGATTLPETLRGVPGLHVARRNASSWAVSARGFSSVNSEKLLVLSDTRSIYTPLVSGVQWDVQDYLLGDIERIEVIRGPGASLWGSNAVNGVINITSKHAADTHGTLVEATAGTEERARIAARHGDQVGDVHYRVFGTFSKRDDTFSTRGRSDAWEIGHVGFRTDWGSSSTDEFTVQGDIYAGEVEQLSPSIQVGTRPSPPLPWEASVAGGNVLGRWRRWLTADSDIQIRAYYDRTHRDDPSFTDDLDTFDFDLQHRFIPVARHELVWGLNYRYTVNRNRGKGVFELRPESSTDQLVSAFVQDKISFGAVAVTVGTKAEQNDFSGFELQPSLRAAWDVTDRQTIWAAVSRAARIPTRLERDIFVAANDPNGPVVARLLGNRDFEAEELTAYELGYRWRASSAVHLDVSVFENTYDDLASMEIGDPFVEASGRTIVPIMSRNLSEGRARGVETMVTCTPTEWWRLAVSHSYLDLEISPGGQDANRGEFYEGATPRHQFAVSSYLTLPGGFELDAHYRSIGAIRRLPEDSTGAGIAGYDELDLRVSWLVLDGLQLSVVGQNLLHKRHVEFGGPNARGAIERGVYGKVELSF